jgi:hypothetical protein
MKQGRKYQVLSEFWLRIIALISMTFDHVGAFLNMYSASFPNSSNVDNISIAFRIIGRLALPLFAFMLAEGLRHTHDKVKYLLRLTDIWAVCFVAELVIYILTRNGVFNYGYPPSQIFTSLLLYAGFAIILEQKGWKKYLAILPVLYILLSYAADISLQYETYSTTESIKYALSWQFYFPEFLRAQYSLYGFLVFLGFYFARPFADRFLKRTLSLDEAALGEYQKTDDYQQLLNIVAATSFAVITIAFWGLSYIYTDLEPHTFDIYRMGWQCYGLVVSLLLLCYNGKRGYDKPWFRYFNYLYYPVHIAIIALIFVLIFR